jgi:hypothetical protein
MDDIASEVTRLRETLGGLQAQVQLANAFEAHVIGATALLSQLQAQVDEVDRTDDSATKRQIVELLVDNVTVNKTGKGVNAKTELTLRYSFNAPNVLALRTRPPSEPRCPARRGA